MTTGTATYEENGVGPDDPRTTYEYVTFPRQFLSYRWFKPLLVGALVLVFMVVLQIALIVLGIVWEGDIGFLTAITGGYDTLDAYRGPSALITLGGIAVLLPSLALAALIVGDRPFSSYSSSRGGWNWGAFARCLAVSAVVLGVPTVVELLFFNGDAQGAIRFTVTGFIACTLLVPLQCVAEEYVFRGLVMQAVGSWTKLPALAIAAQAAVFAALHPYNAIGVASIFIDGVIWGVVAWKTRGLEATSAAHIVNNLIAFHLEGFGFEAVSSQVELASFFEMIVISGVFAVAVIALDGKFNWFTSKGDGTAAHNRKVQAKAAQRKTRPPAPPQVQPQPVAPQAQPQPVAPQVQPQPVAPQVQPQPVAPQVQPQPVAPLPQPPLVQQVQQPLPHAQENNLQPAHRPNISPNDEREPLQ